MISFDPADLDSLSQYFSDLYGAEVPAAAVLPAILTTEDVQLVSVNRDGSTTPVFDFNRDVLQEQIDPTGTELIVPLQVQDVSTGQPVNVNLSPGTYQVQLTADTSLAYAISESYQSSGQPLWDFTEPETLSTFTVLGSGATFANATALSVSTTVQNYDFSLNPDDFHSAVDLYKITLPPGQLWELGLSVQTESIGSPLLTTLSLFNSNGQLLAESDAGEGFSGDPNDPYLFVGLDPTPGSNTYYIGVSGYGNTPFGSHGYDPILGIPGTGGMSQPGGPFPFELSLAAQPHDQATQLVNFSLNDQDPLDPVPTSMTLTFSGPIDITSIFTPDRQETSLEVVDTSGKSWPITAETYQASNAQLTLIFDEPLPPGEYSLLVPSAGGLTDLAGESVVAIGEPAGVLASWDVTAAATTSSTDLGILWPGKAGAVWPTASGSFSGSTELAPEQGASYRWVVIVPGYYQLQTQLGTGQLTIENTGNGSTTVLVSQSSGTLNTYFMYLNPGVYELRLVNVGHGSTLVNWVLSIEGLDWEKIINNGINQTSALSLMTFAPAATGVDVVASTGLLSIGVAPVLGLAGGPIGPVPPSLLISPSTTLAGQPIEPGEPIAMAEGPLEAATTAGGSSIGQSILASSATLFAAGVGPDDDATGPMKGPRSDNLPDGAGMTATARTLSASIDPGAPSLRADALALAQAEWLDQLDALARAWFGYTRPAAPPQPALADSLSREPATGRVAGQPPVPSSSGLVVSPDNRRSQPIFRGELCAVVSVLIAGGVAYPLRRPLLKWWRTRTQLAAPGKSPKTKGLTGPHPTSGFSRVTTRARKAPR